MFTSFSYPEWKAKLAEVSPTLATFLQGYLESWRDPLGGTVFCWVDKYNQLTIDSKPFVHCE